jgi:hypothetical protein
LNHGEAQAAESLNDFIHKMKICLKELRESRRTLCIIAAVPLTSSGKDLREVHALTSETEELIRIFYAGIRTAIARRANTDGGPSSRVREGNSDFEVSSNASISDGRAPEDDPITGAQPWMLDVGRWMLDVDGRASIPPPAHSPVAPEGPPQ